MKSARIVLAAMVLALGATHCVGRIVYYPQGCADRLVSQYKQAECMACVTRPNPHEFHPDAPDGSRCFPR